MNDPDSSWRAEKAASVIMATCRLLRDRQATPADFRLGLVGVLENATKLFCCARDEMYGNGSRWSPDLVRFLADHPERAEDTLRVVSSEDYRDNYYDEPGCAK